MVKTAQCDKWKEGETGREVQAGRYRRGRRGRRHRELFDDSAGLSCNPADSSIVLGRYNPLTQAYILIIPATLSVQAAESTDLLRR
jgi:hypothetical protein